MIKDKHEVPVRTESLFRTEYCRRRQLYPKRLILGGRCMQNAILSSRKLKVLQTIFKDFLLKRNEFSLLLVENGGTK